VKLADLSAIDSRLEARVHRNDLGALSREELQFVLAWRFMSHRSSVM
jgi:hypothetical protein